VFAVNRSATMISGQADSARLDVEAVVEDGYNP
jgi:hypothetical protein